MENHVNILSKCEVPLSFPELSGMIPVARVKHFGHKPIFSNGGGIVGGTPQPIAFQNEGFDPTPKPGGACHKWFAYNSLCSE